MSVPEVQILPVFPEQNHQTLLLIALLPSHTLIYIVDPENVNKYRPTSTTFCAIVLTIITNTLTQPKHFLADDGDKK